MTINPYNLTKILLEDYPYEDDIKYRLHLSNLSAFDVKVLTEIVFGSLKIAESELADVMEVEMHELLPSIEKLKTLDLFHVENGVIHINKERRKYHERQIEKFDTDFKTDIHFIQNLLANVPLHILPKWYSLPKMTDDIFTAIIEKFFLTPDLYTGYLERQTFEEPLLNSIKKELFDAPGHKLYITELLEKYSISREELEKLILLLEFHMIGFLSYTLIDDQWVEVITPLYEWEKIHCMQSAALSSKDLAQEMIHSPHVETFGFIRDLELILQSLDKRPHSLEEITHELFSHLDPMLLPPNYITELYEVLRLLQLIDIRDGALLMLPEGKNWLQKKIDDKAFDVYRYHHLRCGGDEGMIDRDLKAISKNLQSITPEHWIFFDDFCRYSISSINQLAPPTLVRQGKRWKYVLPEYRKEDLDLMKKYITQIFYYSGIVNIGYSGNQLCFQVTPFGQLAIN